MRSLFVLQRFLKLMGRFDREDDAFWVHPRTCADDDFVEPKQSSQSLRANILASLLFATGFDRKL